MVVATREKVESTRTGLTTCLFLELAKSPNGSLTIREIIERLVGNRTIEFFLVGILFELFRKSGIVSREGDGHWSLTEKGWDEINTLGILPGEPYDPERIFDSV